MHRLVKAPKANDDVVDRLEAISSFGEEFGYINYEQCNIFFLFVSRKHRRKGIGEELLQAAKQDLKQRGCEEITLQAYHNSIGFFLNHGAEFVEKNNQLFMDRNKTHTLDMKITLKKSN